jgi:MarR family transcriptional regulator, 2-MHQ and catechol-resistance regulon repressor
MGIQEDIKQKRAFRNEYQKAAVNLMFTHGWLQERLRDAVDSYDITLQQYNVLRILRGSYPDPISTQEIRKRMLDKMSDVSRIVDRLILKNLVTKRVCGSDKRLVDVTISESGLKLLTEMDSLEAQMDETMKNLSEEEAKSLNLLLDKLRNA